MIEQIVGVLAIFILGIFTYRNRGKLFPEEKIVPKQEINNEAVNKANNRPLPKLISDVNEHYRPSHSGGRPTPKRKR